MLPVIVLPPPAGEFYGAIRAKLTAADEMIENNNLWIAAHAKAGLIPVSDNERESRRIQGLEILNWAESSEQSTPCTPAGHGRYRAPAGVDPRPGAGSCHRVYRAENHCSVDTTAADATLDIWKPHALPMPSSRPA